MANCLKTQLKEVVQNDNLIRIGELRISVVPDATNKILISFRNKSNEAIVVSASEPILSLSQGQSEGSTSVTIPADSIYFTPIYGISSLSSSTAYEISIISKYNLGDLQLQPFAGTIDLTYLNGVTTITEFRRNSLGGKVCGRLPEDIIDLSVFSDFSGVIIDSERASLTRFGFNAGKSPIFTTEDCVAYFKNLSVLVDNGSNHGLTGDIAELGKLSSLTTFAGSNVSGSLESFVANARRPVAEGGGGHESGSLTMSWLPANKVTFNGKFVPNKESYSFSWTASTITLDGVTIDV